ncbi:MAG: hypothetical protein JKX84_01270 [Flavobacteriales bacterium]|nr:hypothetical protein [Flavobacteriales bacterium]
MDEHQEENKGNSESKEGSSRGGREKQKVRIKYRQRVKIKKRPRGYKLKKSWKKNRKNFFAWLVLIGLLLGTLFMVVQVGKQTLEKRQHENNQRK